MQALLSSVLDLENLQRMIDQKYIAVKKHPSAQLWILNYTAAAQYDEMWNRETEACRGLIVSGPDGPVAKSTTVVARPFTKFYNASQHLPFEDAPLTPRGTRKFTPGPLPVGETFEVFAKMDGSLGVLYFLEGRPCIATRGSFISEQSQWATAFYREHFAGVEIPEGVTYLFEIIYRENRIVVEYEMEGLVLLAVIETATGRDLSLPAEWPGPVVERYEFSDFDAVSALVESNPEEYFNAEGFVVRFSSGVRAKMKFAEYCRLHRIVTGVSSKTVYETIGVVRLREHFDAKTIGRALGMDPSEVAKTMSVADPMAQLLDRVPDEFYAWTKATISGFDRQVAEIEVKATAAYEALPKDDRKAAAQQLREMHGVHSGIVFKMLDGKPWQDLAWKEIRPEFSKPFTVDADG